MSKATGGPAAASRPSAIDTESSSGQPRAAAKCSNHSERSRPGSTPIDLLTCVSDPHRPPCLSMTRRRSTAATAAANGSNRTALKRLKSPYIDALTCLNGLY